MSATPTIPGVMLTLAEEHAVRWAISAPGPRNVPVLDALRLRLEQRELIRANGDAKSAWHRHACPECSGSAPKGAA